MYCLGPNQPHQPELNIKLLTYLLTLLIAVIMVIIIIIIITVIIMCTDNAVGSHHLSLMFF